MGNTPVGVLETKFVHGAGQDNLAHLHEQRTA